MASAPGSGSGATAEKKVEKSYLASAVDSINPWNTSRSGTPTPKEAPKPPPPKPKPTQDAPRKADDHSTNPIYGQSFKRYPPECPPLNVMWFHAIDVPKRKPQFLKSKTEKEKEDSKPQAPKKYSAFSKNDSISIENAYQTLLEEAEEERGKGIANSNRGLRSASRHGRATDSADAPNTTIDQVHKNKRQGLRVPVNEDFLFDVDIEERELAPVYWLGPVYDVRRGSWFYQEGSTLRPCEENLAAQLEEGYLKVKPWTYPTASRSRSNSGAGPEITPKASRENLKASKPSKENLKAAAASQTETTPKAPPAQVPQHQPQTYRLFGTYMNSIATYQDSTTAWLSSDSMLSWVTSTVYQRFAGGGYMSGVKLVRGYTEPGKKEAKRPTTPTTASATTATEQSLPLSEKEQKALKRRSAPPLVRSDSASGLDPEDEGAAAELERRENRLKRQFSPYVENSEELDKREEEIRKRDEQEIQDDYNAPAGETQGRDIEHLVLVTHGIGQLLGLRMESVNFVHDVNILRKTMKGVYAHSADLRALNSEFGEGPGNCRVQVLPVCWRHLLDFPKRKEKKGELDLSTAAFEDEDDCEQSPCPFCLLGQPGRDENLLFRYANSLVDPSLDDITIEGVAFARSLISDLALDVLLYQSAYREQIVNIVLRESNRIYKLFKERNPEFKGKVHIMGHSLGSAIMFDLLCRQKEKPKDGDVLRNPLRFWPGTERSESTSGSRELAFSFDVEDFYCLGSPIGLFQMLKGRTISARHLPLTNPSESPLSNDHLDDPFFATSPTERVSSVTGLPSSVSSPRVKQLFNIFHPSDPISYRMEPLISPAMSALKPQVLPYTKKGIFNSVAPQGLSGIGVKVGQSVSGLWSSISGGIASSLLNRSLGFSNEDVANYTANSGNNNVSASNAAPVPPSAIGGNNNMVGGAGIPDVSAQSERTAARKKALARQQSISGGVGWPDGDENGSGPTLIDDDLETLYARFQKKRIEEHQAAASRAEEGQALGDAWAAEEQKAQKLRREETKVRALNRNGRVDYSIQESVLDFNPINTIASHMAYWQDEDVSHFIMSQLLSSRKTNLGRSSTR